MSMSMEHEYKKLNDLDDDVEVQVTAVHSVPVATATQQRRGKVIGGILGLILFGPIGAILGVIIGHYFFDTNNQNGGSSCCSCCCKLFCIAIAVMLLVGLVMGGVMYAGIKDAVQQFTVTTPLPTFPVVTMTDAKLDVVQSRVRLFVDQLRAQEGDIKEDLVITEDELNGFIGQSEYLRGNMHVTLKEGAIEEEYSLDVDMLPGGHGRYFVGSDYVKVAKDGNNKNMIEVNMETQAKHSDWFDGPLLFAQLHYLVEEEEHGNILELYLEKGSFFGQDAPQDFIDQRENLLADLYSNQDDIKNVLEGIDNVSIQAGKIVITPRRRHYN